MPVNDLMQFMLNGMWESFTFFALFHVFISLHGYGLKWAKEMLTGGDD